MLNPKQQNKVKKLIKLIKMKLINKKISKNLQYRTAQYIISKAPNEFSKIIKEVILMYQKGSFQVTHIFCDINFDR